LKLSNLVSLKRRPWPLWIELWNGRTKGGYDFFEMLLQLELCYVTLDFDDEPPIVGFLFFVLLFDCRILPNSKVNSLEIIGLVPSYWCRANRSPCSSGLGMRESIHLIVFSWRHAYVDEALAIWEAEVLGLWGKLLSTLRHRSRESTSRVAPAVIALNLTGVSICTVIRKAGLVLGRGVNWFHKVILYFFLCDFLKFSSSWSKERWSLNFPWLILET